MQRSARQDGGGTARRDDGGDKRTSRNRNRGDGEGEGVPERYAMEPRSQKADGADGKRQAENETDRHALKRLTQHELDHPDAVRMPTMRNVLAFSGRSTPNC